MKENKSIVCAWTPIGAVRAEVVVSKVIEQSELSNLRRRLLRRKNSPIVDVSLVVDNTSKPAQYKLSATLGLYVNDCSRLQGISYFLAEVEKLTKTRCCIDCTNLCTNWAPRRKSRR